MKWKRFVVLLLSALFLILLPAGSCQVTPGPLPVPAVTGGVGGAESFGGATAAGTGGQEAGGQPDQATGGTTAVTTPPEQIAWPECGKRANKLSQKDIERLKRSLMPARPKQVVKHPKASYLTIEGLPDQFWRPLGPALQQGDLGSCTGNAFLLSRVSQPWTWPWTLDPNDLEKLAVDIYSDATHRDPFPGTYPPDDTGSNGQAVMAVGKERGLISGWTNVYTFAGLQRQLQKGPCILGSNWYTSMFSPNACGQLDIWGVVEGGHETVVRGIRYSTKQVLLETSWGDDFGVRSRGRGGYFWLTFGSLERLISEGADIECAYLTGGT